MRVTGNYLGYEYDKHNEYQTLYTEFSFELPEGMKLNFDSQRNTLTVSDEKDNTILVYTNIQDYGTDLIEVDIVNDPMRRIVKQNKRLKKRLAKAEMHKEFREEFASEA